MTASRNLTWIAACLLAACDQPAPTPSSATPRPAAPPAQAATPPASGRSWLAGDHHVHSRFSVGWDAAFDPPSPIIGGDAIYPIPMNALMGRYHGLSWMVATDHGGPLHSRVNHDQAYPELQLSRMAVPEVIQFFGMELDSAAADHSSIIVPRHDDEAGMLLELESRFDWEDRWPPDPSRNTPELALEGLRFMNGLDPRPLVFVHHPSRSARPTGEYGLYEPAEIRDWNDAAPRVAVGMEGAPGHQAAAMMADGSVGRANARGAYGQQPTYGGYDRMTAQVGGLWDALLGEGRRWWITANSDSHVHYTEGGWDFWPGEYAKTWVWAEHSYADVLDGLRHGRIFVATGDLVTELHVTVGRGDTEAGIGGELVIEHGESVDVEIRFLDPDNDNFRGENPAVRRVDLIVGDVTGPALDRNVDTHPTARVVMRWTDDVFETQGRYRIVRTRLGPLENPVYLRVRGTNTEQLEPDPDPLLEDPWSDLWFYANPVFVIPGGIDPAEGD